MVKASHARRRVPNREEKEKETQSNSKEEEKPSPLNPEEEETPLLHHRHIRMFHHPVPVLVHRHPGGNPLKSQAFQHLPFVAPPVHVLVHRHPWGNPLKSQTFQHLPFVAPPVRALDRDRVDEGSMFHDQKRSN